MKLCVYGAGAVGGSLAVRLAGAGEHVSVIARGEHADAIRRSGLVLEAGGRRSVAHVACLSDPARLPPQDAVFVTVKATHLAAIAGPLARIDSPRIVFAMNGIPWWFGDAAPASLVERLDRGGRMRTALARDRIVGGVVYSSNEVIAPGVIRNDTPTRNRMILGRPDGASDPAVDALVAVLARAGYDARATPRIREELWTKMLIVVSMSPVAALTGAPLSDLVRDRATLALMSALIHEAADIGRRLGYDMPDDLDERLAFFHDKPVRPSLLQDFELGRAPELDAGILAVREIAQHVGVPAPMLGIVSALLFAKARAAGFDL